MISLEPEIRSTFEDSADYYSVKMMDTAEYPTTPPKLLIPFGHSKFRVMVDSGSLTGNRTDGTRQ